MSLKRVAPTPGADPPSVSSSGNMRTISLKFVLPEDEKAFSEERLAQGGAEVRLLVGVFSLIKSFRSPPFALTALGAHLSAVEHIYGTTLV